jgi:hypothetical protein
MSTDFSQKNAPDFQSWQPATLAKFAQDAYAKMQEQEDQLEQLRQDLKTAINAYRDLLCLARVEQGTVTK